MMVSERRDLRTGLTYWQIRSAPQPGADRLLHDLEVDALVIGAGITGALIAERLSRRLRVAVVDRRGPACGSTLASTALVIHEIDTPLIRLSRKIGETRAARAWRRSRDAVIRLAHVIDALGIPCDATQRPCLYLTGTELDAAEIEAEAEARRAIGLDARVVPHAWLTERFGIEGRDSAILSNHSLSADPARMALGFLDAVRRHGAAVYAPVDIVEISSAPDGVLAVSAAGPAVRARIVVLATGYEMPKPIPPRGRVVSTYAIATRSQPDRLWFENALIWEASDPYLYMRTTADGRILCGGEDEQISDADARDALIGEKAGAISRKLGRLCPRVDPTATLAWAGAFGVTDTGLPLIGEMPEWPGCWAALGFGGNGMVYAEIAAEVIAAAVDDRVDPDADVFAVA